MATGASDTAWHISGDYFESCSCDYVCPCIYTNLSGEPTHGDCHFAMVFHINQGSYGNTALDGLSFVVAGYTPGVMGQGNGSFGLIVDERASKEQQDAITTIATGQAGGPMAALGPIFSTFDGVETRPVTFDKNGLQRSASVPGVVDEAIEGVESLVKTGEPLYMDNTGHPANARLALAKASRSHVHAFGRNWDDDSGQNNGHYAPFTWQGGA